MAFTLNVGESHQELFLNSSGLIYHLRVVRPCQRSGRQHGLRVPDPVQPVEDPPQHPAHAHRLSGSVPSLGAKDQQVHERRRTCKLDSFWNGSHATSLIVR